MQAIQLTVIEISDIGLFHSAAQLKVWLLMQAKDCPKLPAMPFGRRNMSNGIIRPTLETLLYQLIFRQGSVIRGFKSRTQNSELMAL